MRSPLPSLSVARSERASHIRMFTRTLAFLLAPLVPVTLAAAPAQASPATSVAIAALGPDTDGDGLDDASDGCVAVASSNPTGCPTMSRRVRLRLLDGTDRLQARISSASTACSSRSRVKLWQVAPGRDVRVQTETASFAGRRLFTVRRDMSYYVTVSASYAPGIAECAEATSPVVRVPRLS